MENIIADYFSRIIAYFIFKRNCFGGEMENEAHDFQQAFAFYQRDFAAKSISAVKFAV